MNSSRFDQITNRYSGLRVAIIGDFCLDRYLEIDRSRAEISIETGLEVHNVLNVRSQPGGAGTILNNLVALGVGKIFPVGFCGDDGEGYELQRALQAKAGVNMDFFQPTPERKTFTYTKPLVLAPGKAPVELNRLDQKNWDPTPKSVEELIIAAYLQLVPATDAIILLDQVDLPETGVVTKTLLREIQRHHTATKPLIIADSRRSLKSFPAICYKMNRSELARFIGRENEYSVSEVCEAASTVAEATRQPVFITMAEQGIVGAAPGVAGEHLPSLPLRGEIDVVGAGDSVTANLVTALASGASVREAIELAIAASSLVIHQLGTTGTATVSQIRELMTDCLMLHPCANS